MADPAPLSFKTRGGGGEGGGGGGLGGAAYKDRARPPPRDPTAHHCSTCPWGVHSRAGAGRGLAYGQFHDREIWRVLSPDGDVRSGTHCQGAPKLRGRGSEVTGFSFAKKSFAQARGSGDSNSLRVHLHHFLKPQHLGDILKLGSGLGQVSLQAIDLDCDNAALRDRDF